MSKSFKDSERARDQFEISQMADIGRKEVLAYVVREKKGGLRQEVLVEINPDLEGQQRIDIVHSLSQEREILTELNHVFTNQPTTYKERYPVVKLYGTLASFSRTGETYLRLEYLPGGTLADRIQRQKRRIDEADATIIARDLALAVKAHHAHGIVHRNITPQSVYIITSDERIVGAKLGGYHLAQTPKAPETQALDKAKFERDYLSPEQIKGETVTTATDLYQIGLLLWEMLTCVSRATNDSDPITAEALGCSSKMEAIIQSALAYKKTGLSGQKAVYSNADELLTDLEDLIKNPAPPVRVRAPEQRPDETWKRFIVPIAIAAILLLIGILVVLFATRPPPLKSEEILATANALNITATAVAQAAATDAAATAVAAQSTAERVAVIQTSAAGAAENSIKQTAFAVTQATLLAGTAQAEAAQTEAAQTAIAETTLAASATSVAASIYETTVAATNVAATATAAARPPAPPTVTPILGLAISKKPPPSVDRSGCISIGISGINTSGWTLRPDSLNMSASFSATGDARLCGFAGGQQFTFTVFNQNGRSVRGGVGIPAREGEIFVGTWRRLN